MNASHPNDPHKTLAMTAAMAALDRMNISQLQDRWREVFHEPCTSRNRQYLLKRLRYRIQEQANGGLSEAARQRILMLAGTSTFRQRPPASLPAATQVTSAPPPDTTTPTFPLNTQASASTPNEPSAHPTDARLPAPGGVLRRIYQDKVYEVKVLADGFEYEGKQHKSLSRVARLITGTSWNGFAFFKLEKSPITTEN